MGAALFLQHAGTAWWKGDGVASQLLNEINKQKNRISEWVASIQQKGARGVVGVLNVGIRQEFPHNVGKSWSCRFTTPYSKTTVGGMLDPNSLEHCVVRYLCEVSDKHHYLYDEGVCPPRGARTGSDFVGWKESFRAIILTQTYSNGAYRQSSVKRNLKKMAQRTLENALTLGSLFHGSSWQICEVVENGRRETGCVGRMDAQL